ncbi:MAG: hypothetical protein M5U26_08240 [Planctomycetota bacterium]|nr:hypothetical protein [Planctomycetota bacterium]
MHANAPIVSPAAAAADLPGLGSLCNQLNKAAADAWKADAGARLARLEICRRLCCFGREPAVVAEVERINKPDGKARPGRPKTGASFALEGLSKTSGVPKRTLERWYAEWRRIAKLLGIDLHDDRSFPEYVKKLAASRGQTPEAWLSERLDAEEELIRKAVEDLLKLPPKKFAEKIVAPVAGKLRRLLKTPTGHTRMLDAAQRKALREQLNQALAGTGLAVGEGSAKAHISNR